MIRVNILEESALTIVRSTGANPVTSIIVVMLFYIMVNITEGQIEKLIFGERFEHWGDPIIALLFIAYSAYTVWFCAAYQIAENK